MRFFPKTEDFFALFEKQAVELNNASKLIMTLEHDNDIRKKAHKMKQIEHQGDEVTHEIIKTLNTTFITPFDREDITALSSHLDDVLDELERAVNRIYIYDVDPTMIEINRYCRLIEKSIEQVVKAIKELRNSKDHNKLLKHCEIVNLIENQADDLHRDNLQNLFLNEKDPIKIMKLREIFEAFESVTDRLEDIANNIESVVIKHM